MIDIIFGADTGWAKFADTMYPLNPREVESIDEDVKSVIYHEAIAQKFLPTREVPKGQVFHKVSTAQKPSPPIVSKDFMPESMDKIAKKEVTFYLLGISKDFFLSMTTIDASRNSPYHRGTIDSLHIREMVAFISDFKERIIWRGSTAFELDPGDIEPNCVGILNTTGVNTFEAGIGLNDETGAAGDIPASVMSGANELIKDKFRPPFVVVMTPYLYGQACLNQNATTMETDIERVLGLVDKDKQSMISRIEITPHLVAAVETGANAVMVVIAPKTPAGENTIEILEAYPVWHYPITISALGIQGKVLWMGGVAVIRPTAVALAEAIDIDGVA